MFADDGLQIRQTRASSLKKREMENVAYHESSIQVPSAPQKQPTRCWRCRIDPRGAAPRTVHNTVVWVSG